jgi:hypothetical protein
MKLAFARESGFNRLVAQYKSNKYSIEEANIFDGVYLTVNNNESEAFDSVEDAVDWVNNIIERGTE